MPLFALTLIVSAVLIFCLELMFAKMVLPLLGGSPAVWNTAMMFFQGVLLAGYAYAHLATRLLAVKPQILLHLVLFGLGALGLPIQVAAGWVPPTHEMPILWLTALFAVSIGLPFFVVSATAPLLQRWFSHSGHAVAGDPYFLYAASNFGSILALLAYPTALEPLLRLNQQSRLWSASYGLLAILIAACAATIWQRKNTATVAAMAPTAEAIGPALGWRQRVHWLALAFAPSSLLLGVTSHITTDVAAIPMLWVVPLTLYLLTFVIAFARRPVLRHDWMVAIQPFILLPLVPLMGLATHSWYAFLAHLVAFFVTAMVCHGELNRRRPPVRHLTEYYLWMSVGGLLGGVFNALIAPVVFDHVYEYPLALAFALLLRPHLDGDPRRVRWSDLVWPAAILLLIPTRQLAQSIGLDLPEPSGTLLYLSPVLGLCYLRRRRPTEFGLAILASLVAVFAMERLTTDVLLRERSFFGVNTLTHDETGQFIQLVNGTTVHGTASVDPAQWREPLSYYHREGPPGQLFAALEARARVRSVGVVGLGIGSMACYRRPGQAWTFFEIDPLVERIARDMRFFHYMSECAGDTSIVLGDARLSLVDIVDRSLDILIIDAFSSDSIPMHLLTREALELYMQKLADHGVLALHISNKFLDLEPVIGNLVAEDELSGLIQYHGVGADNVVPPGTLPSIWVAVTRTTADLDILRDDPRWRALKSEPELGVWSDDFSNILDVVRWR